MRLYFFAILLALTGCSGLGNVHESFDLDKAGATGQGLVIGTFTTDKPDPHVTIYTTMRILATPNPRVLGLTEIVADSSCNLHFSDESPFKDYCGRLVALKLPAGQYQIFWLQSSQGRTLLGPRHFEPVTFTVKAGRATYIGNIHMTLEADAKTMLGVPLISGGWPVVRDARERDIPLLKQAVPALGDGNIDYTVLTFPPKGEVSEDTPPLILAPVPVH